MVSERELRAAFRELAPPVEEVGVWEALHQPQPRRARRVFLRWRFALATVGLLILAGLAFQGYEQLRPEPSLVITEGEIGDSGETVDSGGSEFGEGSSWRAAQIRDYFGLWSGNVETIPERPQALPPQFFDEPQVFSADAISPRAKVSWGAAIYGFPTGARTSVLTPNDVPKPLWVFASEIENPGQAEERMIEARQAGRPVVVIGADATDVASLFPSVESLVHFPPDVPTSRKLIAYLDGQLRTSTLLVPLGGQQPYHVNGKINSSDDPIEPLAPGEEIYWQMAALTLWQPWPVDLTWQTDYPDSPLAPSSRGSWDESGLEQKGAGLGTRWAWENGAPPEGGPAETEPDSWPTTLRSPPGLLSPARHYPATAGGEPRYQEPKGEAFWAPPGPAGRFSPDESQSAQEMFRSGQAMVVFTGYDGYEHAVLEEDFERVISPVVPPPADAAPARTTTATMGEVVEPIDEAALPVEYMERVPAVGFDEVLSLEVRPGETRWDEARRTYSAAEQADLIRRLIGLLRETEGVAPRNVEEVTEGPNLVVLHLTGGRELRFTVELYDIEKLAFLPAVYLSETAKQMGLLVNGKLDRELRHLYLGETAPVEVRARLNSLRKTLEAHGLAVLDVRAETVDPLGVSVTLPTQVMDSSEGIFASHKLHRLVAVSESEEMPIDWLDEYIRKEDGEDVQNSGFRVDGAAPPSQKFALEEVRRQVEERANEAARDHSISVDRVEVTDEAGLVVTVRATNSGDVEDARFFVGQVQGRIQSLHRRPGSGVVAQRMAIDNAEGRPLLRTVEDFQLGSFIWWGKGPPGYRPGWQ